MKKILVVGGTGMLGQPVVARLIIDGYDVKVLTHSPDKANAIFGDKAAYQFGDVTDVDSLVEPMIGCDAVYINLGAKMNPPDYERIEYKGVANIIEAAKNSEINQIGMISGLTVSEERSDCDFIKWKAKAERALVESGVPYTIFKCCWFFESMPLFVIKNQATVFGKQPLKRAWVASTDYAMMVSKAFDTLEAQNKIFHIRGMDRLSIPEALTKFCEIVYPEAKLSKIPLWVVSMMTKFSRKSATRGILDFMKYFEKTPDPETTDDAEKILGPALTTLEDWAKAYKRKIGE